MYRTPYTRAMRYLLPILIVLTMPGCSSARLKKCEEKALDAALQVCPEQVQGHYRLCQKPVDLYLCSDPQ